MDKVIDEPVNLSIINSCGWSITEAITHSNRYQLIQCLIHNEVITQRESNMRAFFRGLNVLKMGDLILSEPEKLGDLFMYRRIHLSVNHFKTLMSSVTPPSGPKKVQSLEHFKEYLRYLEGQ